MIVFDLCCDRSHRFEGWFKDQLDFETQNASSLISCPTCGSGKVRRLPSAINFVHGRTEGRDDIGERSSSLVAANKTSVAALQSEVKAVYRHVYQRIVERSEDVGPVFAEEARKIHYGESPVRNIRGQASADELEALADEGIECLSLPVPDENDLHH